MSVPASAPASREHRALPYTLVAALAVALGLAVRLSYVLPASFPLVDGGLFYAMVGDLQRARYALPWSSSYNGGQIPFTYPPLALYLVAMLQGLTNWDLLQIFRFWPLAVNTLTILAFLRLGEDLLPSKQAALLATLAFSVWPPAFQWLIMGGGVTRAPGLLFAILAVDQAYLLYTRRRARQIWLTALFGALAVLTHPEMAWLAAYSIALLLVTYGRDRQGLLASLAVLAAALAFTAPWWVIMMARYGIPPFAAAITGSEEIWPLYTRLLMLLQSPTGEALFPVLGVLAFLGALVCLRDRQMLLPLWVLATFILQSRGPAVKAAAPLALLAGIGAAQGLFPLLFGEGLAPIQKGDSDARAGNRRRRRAMAIFGCICIWATVAAMVGTGPWLAGLSAGEQEAMRWVASHTPVDRRFLVISGDPWWGTDRSAEWFPVLARRISVGTVQGSEWLGGGEFTRRARADEALRRSLGRGADGLEQWAAETGVAFTDVYIAERSGDSVSLDGVLPLFQDSLRRDPRYAVVYEGPGALILERRGPPAPYAPALGPGMAPGTATGLQPSS